MKDKKRKKYLKKLLNKVMKEIVYNMCLVNPLNAVDLRLHLISIVMDFCGVSNKESHIFYTNSYYDFADKLIQRLIPSLDVKIRNRLNINKCSVCVRFLDSYDRFPKDFPDQFKICCNCKHVAEYIYNLDHPINSYVFPEGSFDKYYEKYQEKFDNLFVIKKKGVVI